MSKPAIHDPFFGSGRQPGRGRPKSRARIAAERAFKEVNTTEPAPQYPEHYFAELLPREIHVAGDKPMPEVAARTLLEQAWGIRWISPAKRLFYRCRLPDGWHVASLMSSGFWAVLKDSSGATRAEIFDRTAVGDDRAFMRLCQRYAIEEDYSDDSAREMARHYVVDRATGEKLNASPWRALGDSFGRKRSEVDLLAWLDQQFPKYRDPLEYWPPADPAQPSSAP
jgi:hypothetical protein